MECSEVRCFRKHPRILCLDHIDNDGRQLFEQNVKMDLEGMVGRVRTLSRNRETVAALDQGEESAV
jgi:hypothetical protein